MDAVERLDYSELARTYDRSRKAEPAIVQTLLDNLRALDARSVVDVGAGTCNYTEKIKRAGFETIALDGSCSMLQQARGKDVAHRLAGLAEYLPLKSGSIDAAISVNLLHHLEDLEAVFRELRRVVTKGVTVQVVARENLESLWYRRYFPEIDRALLPLHPSLGFLITALLRANFGRVDSRPVFYSGWGDMTFESARHRPELLFDENFRGATSGFHRLGPEATNLGLALIRADLESSRLEHVIEQHEEEYRSSGDCFVLTALIV